MTTTTAAGPTGATAAIVSGTEPYAWPYDGCLDPARLALVIAGSDPSWRARSAGRAAVEEALGALADAVRAAGGLVVHVHHGTDGAAVRRNPRAVPLPDIVVSATGLDGFYGSPLDRHLRRAGRDQLLLAGYGMEGPVHSTMRGANDQGYECLLVIDASAPLDPATAPAAVSSVTMSGGIFGAVGHADAVRFALGDPAVSRDPSPDPPDPSSRPQERPMTTPVYDPAAVPDHGDLPDGVVAADPYPWPYDGPLDLTRTALINIDWQTDFCGPGGYVDAMGYDLSLTRAGLEPTQRVLAACREAGMFILHTREGHRPDLADCPPNKRWRSQRIGGGIGDPGPGGRMLVRGEPGWDIVPEVYPVAGEVIIDKPGKGSFYGTDIDLVLRTRGITHLILTGITTDVCVHTTMREANDRGFECLLLSDCTGATDYGNYLAALKMVTMQGGVFGAVAPSSALLAALKAT